MSGRKPTRYTTCILGQKTTKTLDVFFFDTTPNTLSSPIRFCCTMGVKTLGAKSSPVKSLSTSKPPPWATSSSLLSPKHPHYGRSHGHFPLLTGTTNLILMPQTFPITSALMAISLINTSITISQISPSFWVAPGFPLHHQ